MVRCHNCGVDADLPFRCQYCGGEFCETHRLPEAHDCDGVEFLAATGKRFETKQTNEVVNEGEGIQAPEPIEPEHTVGTTPDPDYATSPDVELKDTGNENKKDNSGFWNWLHQLFRR